MTFSETYDQGYEEGTSYARNLTHADLRATHTRVAQTVLNSPENGYATGMLVAVANEINRRGSFATQVPELIDRYRAEGDHARADDLAAQHEEQQ